jgi:hypothetical protein
MLSEHGPVRLISRIELSSVTGLLLHPGLDEEHGVRAWSDLSL